MQLKTINIALALLMTVCSMILSKAQTQCNPEQYTEKGIKKLEQGYTFLKSYPISGENGKQYSYIFSQGTSYLITLANNATDSKGIYITLYDSENREIASSYQNGKFYPAVAFNCSKTGIYHLKFTFQGSKNHCAAGVLAMKR